MSAGYGCLQCGSQTDGLYCEQHRTPAGLPCSSDGPVTTRSADPIERARLESDEISHGLRLLDDFGFVAWCIGQYRADHAGSDPGVPDVIALKAGWGIVCWEAKRPYGGRESYAQRKFRAACWAAGVAHVVGPASSLAAWLRETFEGISTCEKSKAENDDEGGEAR